MPATRVTVASNSKQSQKAPLLIPSSTSLDPASCPSCHSLVIKTAQSKLRLKKASRIFVHGGRELTGHKDWEDVLKDDVVLLVSAGEDYVGSRTEDSTSTSGQGGPHPDANSDCPVELLAEKAFVDTLSVTQLETTARSLPGIVHAVGQPDLHPGTKFPVGAVFVSKGWIHPPLIGGDIGCGMAWYKMRLSRAQVEGDKGRKIAEKLRGLEGSWRTQEAREIWLEGEDAGPVCSAGDKWDASLGTVGAGNHFAELQVVEESSMNNSTSGRQGAQHELFEGEVVLLVHSGSRGYGSHILKHFTKDGGHDSMLEDEPAAKAYLEAHDRACAWASRNRDLIALRFLACLEPGAWDLGLNSGSNGDMLAKADEIREARRAVQCRKVVDIYHNNVEIAKWPPTQSTPNAGLLSSESANLPTPSASSVNGNSSLPLDPATSPTLALQNLNISNGLPRQKFYIHRKGAAPTHNPKTGHSLTFLPLPGSRATPTLILHPTFNPHNAYGQSNALSLAHGAGRALSRAKAATYVAEKYAGKADDLLRGDYVKTDKRGNKIAGGKGGEGRDVSGGCWVVCEEKQLVWEEAPEAYKDVWDVGEDLVARGCCERWGWCRGRVSYKVRKE